MESKPLVDMAFVIGYDVMPEEVITPTAEGGEVKSWMFWPRVTLMRYFRQSREEPGVHSTGQTVLSRAPQTFEEAMAILTRAEDNGDVFGSGYSTNDIPWDNKVRRIFWTAPSGSKGGPRKGEVVGHITPYLPNDWNWHHQDGRHAAAVVPVVCVLTEDDNGVMETSLARVHVPGGNALAAGRDIRGTQFAEWHSLMKHWPLGSEVQILPNRKFRCWMIDKTVPAKKAPLEVSAVVELIKKHPSAKIDAKLQEKEKVKAEKAAAAKAKLDAKLREAAKKRLEDAKANVIGLSVKKAVAALETGNFDDIKLLGKLKKLEEKDEHPRKTMVSALDKRLEMLVEAEKERKAAARKAAEEAKAKAVDKRKRVVSETTPAPAPA